MQFAMDGTPIWPLEPGVAAVADPTTPNVLVGPFGPAHLMERVRVNELVQMYMDKCGLDVSASFGARQEVALYRCETTGIQFWWPSDIAGDECFYRAISKAWPSYYLSSRWEYGPALRHVRAGSSVLEIGCGQGYFLREAEKRGALGVGLEYNQEAIDTRVTGCEIRRESIEQVASVHPEMYDVVCTFQVLEHVRDPASFLRACVRCARPEGTILVSVPNHEYAIHAARQDAFDLPPHHVSHFTPAVLRRIAGQLGVEVEGILVQSRRASIEEVTPATGRSLAYRVAARLARLALSSAYTVAREPGPTMLCVLRKRPG